MTRRRSGGRRAALGLATALAGCAPPPEATAPPLDPDLPVLPARLRKLTTLELERTVDTWLGIDSDLASKLPPDVRQRGYTINAHASVSPTFMVRLARLAPDLAHRSIDEGRGPWATCARDPTPRCRDAFLEAAATFAWRRPPDLAELRALRATFTRGARAAGPSTGAAWVLSSLLQSPGFLYLDELGLPQPASPRHRLDDWAIAAALAYAVTGGPPDAPLLQAASAGRLAQGEQRRAQAVRLLGRSDARHHFRQFVLEWLEADLLEQTTKDPTLFPGYDQAKSAMLEETRDFVDEVMVHEQGSIAALLGAGYTSIGATMAAWYGLTPASVGPRVSLQAQRRVGVLQHASFLSAHAHPDGSSPVQRGDFILRKLLCIELPRPSELDIEVVIPPVTDLVTTRQRFDAHASDRSCRTCHRRIDPLGFGLEHFDAAGRFRRAEGPHPIDARIFTRLGGEPRAFEDSAALARWLARAPEVETCFARQAFRYFSGQADPDVEQTFVDLASRLPPDDRGRLLPLLLAYVASDLFVLREAAP